jgi:hypothetical protein
MMIAEPEELYRAARRPDDRLTEIREYGDSGARVATARSVQRK